ncbi:MAG: hypothetical protein U9Q03_03015 [Patescibacteria group bacterium]|nr:hypothetical protein [Patescibacteria group bacterium]
MKTKIFNLITRVTAIATIASSFYMVSPVKAANFDTMSDTMTRLANGQTADHTVVFDLPSTITFDVSGNTDVLTVDFDATDFTVGGTWVVGDFTFNDGTARTIIDVDEGVSPTADCSTSSTTNDIAVTVDTDGGTFGFTPCDATFAASGAAATVTITIDGTTNGTLTNAATGSSNVALSMTDEGSAAAHTGDIYVIIVDSDQVTVTADVNPTMTFDLDTSIATGGDSSSAYTVALGTLSTGSVSTSGDGTIHMVGIDLDANASGGMVVTVLSASANGMESTSTPADYLDHSAGTLAAGTEGYGICVHRVATTTGTLVAAAFDNDSLTATAGFDDSALCTSGAHQLGTALTTSAQNILNTSSGAISGGRAEILVKAAISSTTPAHDDYQDTLTFIATGTF